MRARRVRLGATLIAAILVVAGSARAQAPDPNSVYIESIGYGGTGCPEGTLGQSIDAERTGFTLIFDQYVASAGPGVPGRESRKKCKLTLDLHVPAGWQSSMLAIDYRGYRQLAEGLQAKLQVGYTPGDDPDTDIASGPLAADYLTEHSLSQNDVKKCHGVPCWKVQAGIKVIRGYATGQGQMTVDSIQGVISDTVLTP